MAPIARNVRAVCRKHPILLAYLFGSQATSSSDRESDTDIAVLFTSTLSTRDRWTLRLRLFQEFASALNLPSEKIDVVSLNDAPLLLQYNATVHGTLLYASNKGMRVGFEWSVWQRYEDELPLRQQEEALSLSRIHSLHP